MTTHLPVSNKTNTIVTVGQNKNGILTKPCISPEPKISYKLVTTLLRYPQPSLKPSYHQRI